MLFFSQTFYWKYLCIPLQSDHVRSLQNWSLTTRAHSARVRQVIIYSTVIPAPTKSLRGRNHGNYRRTGGHLSIVPKIRAPMKKGTQIRSVIFSTANVRYALRKWGWLLCKISCCSRIDSNLLNAVCLGQRRSWPSFNQSCCRRRCFHQVIG